MHTLAPRDIRGPCLDEVTHMEDGPREHWMATLLLHLTYWRFLYSPRLNVRRIAGNHCRSVIRTRQNKTAGVLNPHTPPCDPLCVELVCPFVSICALLRAWSSIKGALIQGGFRGSPRRFRFKTKLNMPKRFFRNSQRNPKFPDPRSPAGMYVHCHYICRGNSRRENFADLS